MNKTFIPSSEPKFSKFTGFSELNRNILFILLILGILVQALISCSSDSSDPDPGDDPGGTTTSSSSGGSSSSDGSSSSVGTGDDPSSSSIASSSSVVATSGTFVDNGTGRDGKTYKWVKIGDQVWMAENLNYAATGSKCGNKSNGTLTDNAADCDEYGRLYDWETAMAGSASSTESPSGVQGVCPDGWHLPSDDEWDELMTAVGGASTAGTELKATSGWYNCGDSDSDTYECLDTYGFSALPGGYGDSGGNFDYAGNNGNWWSATQYDASDAYGRGMNYDYADVGRGIDGKSYLRSVRCLRD